MNTSMTKKRTNLLILLFSAMYFTSYVSRINFGAVILEMVRAEGFLKSDVSLAVTASFVTYGAGQLVSGYMGDRMNPKLLMLSGLLLTALMNILIPFCPTPGVMVAIWAVNGFAQSFMWPPLVKIMAGLFDDETYRIATVRVSWGSSIGTIAVYLFSPLFISTIGWRGMFFFSFSMCIIMAFIWMLALRNTNTSVSMKSDSAEASSGRKNPFSSFALVAIVVAIICQGALRDGITTWMPTYIAEVYNFGSSISILTGVILPIFSIICFRITLWFRNSKVKNELTLSAYIFLAGVVAAVLLAVLSSGNAALSIFLSALLTGAMHGVNLLLVCMLPMYFKNTSTVSGVLNSFTYIGSALSTYGIALISENFGWNTTIWVWAGLALFGGLLCAVATRKRIM